MSNLNCEALLVVAQTNLHAGSGSAEYGVIDNLVQRDVISTLPTVNASSMKGAFREFFKAKLKNGFVTTIFGPEYGGDDDDEGSGRSMGTHAFFDAQMLTMPIRSNVKPFFNATTPEILQAFIDRLDIFSHPKAATYKTLLAPLSAIKPTEGTPSVFLTGDDIQLEDLAAKSNELDIKPFKNLLGNDIAILHENDFKRLCNNENLPVIARNHLENGVSQNLWYEQIVPRQSRFFSLVLNPNDKTEFTKEFPSYEDAQGKKQKGTVVQIGANATVGYGYCEISKL